MERFPQELAHVFAGVFPRGDPYTLVWDQSEVNALERSADETSTVTVQLRVPCTR